MIYLLFVVVILLFTGAALYSLIMSGHVARKGRQVDARVLSCEEVRPGDADSREGNSCYEVTVDFYGLKGEDIKKTFFSQTPYGVGSVIRSRYLDKRGRFYPGVSEDEGKSNRLSGILILGFCIFMLALVLFLWWMDWEYGGEKPQWFVHGFGYVVSILFIAVGASGIVRWRRLEKRASDMQVLEGVQISFREEWSTDSDGDRIRIYYPVYEYELMGEKRRYESRMGGNAKKYRQVGRKVHMLRDHVTNEVFCREDEKSSFGMQVIFGVIGFLTLLLMLYLSFGSAETASGSGAGRGAGSGTVEGKGIEQAISFAVPGSVWKELKERETAYYDN